MTNLRCIHVWRKPELFVATEWHAGPSFFFYDLAPPKVVAGRFLELLEGHEGSVERSRFLVRDPVNVGSEIDSARAAGRAEWANRRATAERQRGRLLSPAPARGSTVIVREVVKIRCTFCGNLVDVADANCPFCGAPL
jgi:rubrerythrin